MDARWLHAQTAAVPTPVPPAPVAAPAAIEYKPTTYVQPPVTNPDGLVFREELQEVAAKFGQQVAVYNFQMTNTSTAEVIIDRVTPQCGCTTASNLPPLPWKIGPGVVTNLIFNMSLVGKMGAIEKNVTVVGNFGVKFLMLRVNIPPDTEGKRSETERAANLSKALHDRQTVLQGDCMECHVTKAIGKMGKELFENACSSTCHGPSRAPMIPDLAQPRQPMDAAAYRQWITDSKPVSLMPAFSPKHPGGFLTESQIESLVQYLVATFPPKTNP